MVNAWSYWISDEFAPIGSFGEESCLLEHYVFDNVQVGYVKIG